MGSLPVFPSYFLRVPTGDRLFITIHFLVKLWNLWASDVLYLIMYLLEFYDGDGVVLVKYKHVKYFRSAKQYQLKR